MSEFFTTAKRFRVGPYVIDITPSGYDKGNARWTCTTVASSDVSTGQLSASIELSPGSDRVKIIVSNDNEHIAVVCESQWYEDLYLLDTQTLRLAACFEGTSFIDGASEGIFLGTHFITLPTFSYEGGCGGLRRVSLQNGEVEYILPPPFFDGLRLWLPSAETPQGRDPMKLILSMPVGLLHYSYNLQSSDVTLDYPPGQLVLNIFQPCGLNHFCQYRFIPRDTSQPFKYEDGTLWTISDDDRRSNRWLNRKTLNTHPRVLEGCWTVGWALDVHTIRSIPLGPDEWGHEMFDTTRSEIGDAVYKLKYLGDRSQVEPIAQTIEDFIRARPELTAACTIVAIPPSNTARPFQPVPEIAASVGARLNLPVPIDYLLKTKQTTPIKGMSDKQKRHEELEGAFRIADERYAGRHVILIDDLFRSGETLNAVSTVLLSQGKVGKVSVVAVTVARSKR